ncbi:MAG: DNA repair protein RecO [Elusimicrobia bacterium]|nr:DNA repair protein RecO [Elusimicrobiota bacterium]
MIEMVQGVVLRSEECNEFDKRLTLYTKEFGKFKAKLVGVKKSASKLRGLTLPFVECRFQIYLHGTPRAGVRDPGRVVTGEILKEFPFLQDHWEKVVEAYKVCEILEMLTQPFYPNLKEYELFISTLSQLAETQFPTLARCRFTLLLLKILGYSLGHHPVWRSYSSDEKDLFKKLGAWDSKAELFSKEEMGRVENLTENYLSLYLSKPLKTEIFQKKISLS